MNDTLQSNFNYLREYLDDEDYENYIELQCYLAFKAEQKRLEQIRQEEFDRLCDEFRQWLNLVIASDFGDDDGNSVLVGAR